MMKNNITDLEKDDLLGPVIEVENIHHEIMEKFGLIYIAEPKDAYHWNYHQRKTYNDKGMFIKAESILTNEIMTDIFDENGYEIESYIHQKDGSLERKSLRKNNEKGKVLEMIHFDSSDKQTDRITWHYDENEKCIRTDQYNTEDELYTVSNRIYTELSPNKFYEDHISTDANGVVTSRSKYLANLKGETIESYQVDLDGNIINTTSYAKSFDNEGNRIEPYNKRNDITFYKTNAENDPYGNWILKINYFCNKPISVFKRKITYAGENKVLQPQSLDFETPIILVNPKRVPTDDRCIFEYVIAENDHYNSNDITLKQAKWIAKKSSIAELFPYFGYYMLYNKEIPSQILFAGNNIEAIALLKEITKYDEAQVIHSHTTVNSNGEQLIRYTLTFRENKGYLLHVSQIGEIDSEEFEIPDFMKEYNIGSDGLVRTSNVIMLYPSEASGKRDIYGLEHDITIFLEKCMLPEIPEKPEIFMVEVASNKFSLESHYVNDNFEIDDLDVNYGFGFEQFHTDLINRFTKEHKGLVLFHGIPGTGKTYYIRHLLREMALANKIVIYMPPNMVDYLSEPGFMTFLSNTVASYSERNLTCVLLIEDAEPLLVARHNEGRVQGITNLLNMSDGLLNDMLKLQIICTFNVDLKQLDAALLRPGRLIARKEFKALPELDANILGQRLGIKYHFDEPATLSEIYAKIKNQNTIIHEEY